MFTRVEKIYSPINNSNKEYSIPNDDGNRHYQEIQEWIADGGTVIDNGGGE